MVFRTRGLKRDVDLIIFDLDGTIAETRQDIAINFAAGFKNIGIDVPMNRLLDLVDGSPLEKTYKVIRPNGTKAEMDKFLDGFKSNQKRRGPGGEPYKHIPELLKALRKQPGVKLAVATARPADNAVRMLKKMGLRDKFDFVTGTDGSGMPHKPAPDMLLYVAKRAGVAPGRTVFVGDTKTDMMAGKSAGMSTVALTYGMGKPGELAAQRPDATTGSAAELFRMFGINRRSGRSDATARQPAPNLRPMRNVLPVESTAF